MISYMISCKNTDGIVIDVCPSLKCNYDCSYCFADVASRSPFMTNEFNIMLNAIPHDSNLMFRLLGGEPTLIPSIVDITEFILNTKNNVQIVTNGSLLHKVKFPKDVSIEISIHYEYIDEVYIENIINGIINNKSNNITIVVNVMSNMSKTCIDKIRGVIDAVRKLKISNVDIGLHPLVFKNGCDVIIDYDKFMIEFGLHDANLRMSGEYELRNLDDMTTRTITHTEYTKIYKLMDNNFSGCLCVNRFYNMSYNFDLSLDCECNNAYKGNIISNPSILTNITKDVVVCDQSYCYDGCYMDNVKHFKTALSLEECLDAG